MGTQPLPKKEAEPLPNFRPISIVVMAGRIKMPLGMEVGLSPGDFVLDGDSPNLSQKRGWSPQFSARVYCGQTAEWIKMPLGTGVGFAQTTLC